MQPSLWTSMFVELSPFEALQHIAALGWPCVELSTEHIGVLGDKPDLEATAGQFRAAAAQAGIAVPQVHLLIGADVASLEEERRRADVATIKRQLDFCELAGIGVGVIHPGGNQVPRLTEMWERTNMVRVAVFRELCDYAGERGVRLAVENMNDRIGVGAGVRRRYGAELWELLDLGEVVDSAALGFCLDTSHANVQGQDLPTLIREMGEFLIALHVSDNDGTGDLHWVPLRGQIDWPPVVQTLRAIGFVGPFNLEIPGERRCPPAFWDARAEYALHVVQVLLKA